MCRLMTSQLEEALKAFPLYSQDGKGDNAICRAVFALGPVRWFILEGERQDDDMTMFGIVTGLIEDEYGYVSLKELSEINVDLKGSGSIGVMQMEDFSPIPLKDIDHDSLQTFLSRFRHLREIDE